MFYSLVISVKDTCDVPGASSPSPTPPECGLAGGGTARRGALARPLARKQANVAVSCVHAAAFALFRFSSGTVFFIYVVACLVFRVFLSFVFSLFVACLVFLF